MPAVSLDPFQNITEVHWNVGNFDFIHIQAFFSDSEDGINPYFGCELTQCDYNVDEVPTSAGSVLEQRCGLREWYTGTEPPGFEDYGKFHEITVSGQLITKWGGLRRQDGFANASQAGTQEVMIYNKNIKEITGTFKNEIKIALRAAYQGDNGGATPEVRFRLSLYKGGEDGFQPWGDPFEGYPPSFSPTGTETFSVESLKTIAVNFDQSGGDGNVFVWGGAPWEEGTLIEVKFNNRTENGLLQFI